MDAQDQETDNIFSEIYNDLLEAIEIEKGNIPLKERKGMPAKTYIVNDVDNSMEKA